MQQSSNNTETPSIDGPMDQPSLSIITEDGNFSDNPNIHIQSVDKTALLCKQFSLPIGPQTISSEDQWPRASSAELINSLIADKFDRRSLLMTLSAMISRKMPLRPGMLDPWTQKQITQDYSLLIGTKDSYVQVSFGYSFQLNTRTARVDYPPFTGCWYQR